MDQLRVKHNQIKFSLLQNAIYNLKKSRHDRPITLLDLGVGRANDINKWKKLGIHTIVGIDESSQQLKEAEARINNVYSNGTQDVNIELLQLDLSNARDIKKMHDKLYSTYVFDIVCSFFSVHYFIKNLATILDNVSLSGDCEFVSVFMSIRPCMFLFKPYFENQYIFIKKVSNDEVVVQFKDTPYFAELQSVESPLDSSMLTHQLKTKFRKPEITSFVKYYDNIDQVSADILLVELMHVSLTTNLVPAVP